MIPPDAPGAGEWVAVALLGKTRGIRGELTAIALSDKPERYETLTAVYLFGQTRAGKTCLGERYTVENAWFHGGMLVLKFAGVDSIEAAELLSGAEARVPAAERLAPGEGAYYHSDLVGCEVFDRHSGERLGRVRAFEEIGAAGLLAMEGGWDIPFARSICVEIDVAAKRIVAVLPEGLRDINRP